MRINKDRCVGCGECRNYCTLVRDEVFSCKRDPRSGRLYYEINEDECVDCGACLRSGVCRTQALYMPENVGWPREIRAQFSNPKVVHPLTQGPGRGTEECKTNEVTGRMHHGQVSIVVELGRPSSGCRFTDVEKVSRAFAAVGVPFEPENPCTVLMDDLKLGTFKKEVLNEKVLSTLVEATVPLEKAEALLEAIRKVSGEVNCAFSVDIISMVNEENGEFTWESQPILKKLHWEARPNGKLNTGLGRPLYQERKEEA